MINKKTKENLLVLCAMAVCIAVFGFANVLSAHITTIANNSSISADYKVQFFDDFNGGVLKEGWKEVSGNRLIDGKWNFDGNTSVVWGNGESEDGGKMLYDTGSTEYAFSVDVKYNTSGKINVHLPVLVVDTASGSNFNGISVNLLDGGAVFYYWSNEYDWGADEQVEGSYGYLKTNEDTIETITYSNLPNYDASTWATSSHTYLIFVETNTIVVYIDGNFGASISRPDWAKNATTCGISATSTFDTNGFAVVEYDNFTVWTKLQNKVDIDDLFAVGKYTDHYATKSGVTYDTETNTVNFSASTAFTWGNRSINNCDISDFTMSYIYQKETTKGISNGNAILFRATYMSSARSGYAVYVAVPNGSSSGTIGLKKMTNYAFGKAVGANTTTGQNESIGNESSVTYALGEVITIRAIGSTITVLINGEEKIVAQDTTYASGTIGFAERTSPSNASAGEYSIRFTNFVCLDKATLESVEDNLTDYTIIDQNDNKQIYCLRKGVEFNESYLDSDIIGFVDEKGKLTSAVTEKVCRASTYAMFDGAAIRYSDDGGLRFSTGISKEDYQAINESAKTVTYGIIMIPTQLLNGELTLETESVGKKAVENHLENGNGFNFIVSLVDIPTENYGTEITARGYMTVEFEDGKLITVYTETLSRSVKQVAETLLDKPNAVYNEIQLAILNRFAGRA